MTDRTTIEARFAALASAMPPIVAQFVDFGAKLGEFAARADEILRHLSAAQPRRTPRSLRRRRCKLRRKRAMRRRHR